MNKHAVQFSETAAPVADDRTVRPTFYNHRWVKPVIYVCDTTGHREWKVEQAVSEWRRSKAGLNLQMTADVAQADILLREADAKGYLGLSSYTTESGGTVITHCDIQLNPFYRDRGVVPECASIHELGHAFGMYHNSGYKRGSAMNASINTATAVGKPSSWDLANLATAYSK